ncbi:nuclear receptor ROR-gamma-like isoform X2 [Passer montanus]|uniref:nuclear receptor ROR-gamma-like isoform X2 n=1 Tax=Passer montanus TaxID=9160 RepID=UPI00195F589B|nr:nuclear receptor ROR-gamma-like isoform X2 [Passer montanus]
MSRDAVKFGRMSKKRRDRLQAEVREQLEKREKNREQNREQNREHREQNREQPEQLEHRENREKRGKGEQREQERAAPGPPGVARCPPLSPAVPAGCPSRAWPAEEATRRGQDGDTAGTAGPIPRAGTGGVPEPPAGLEIELLTQSVLLSHRATCHPRAEDLQGHRWATFSPEEIRAYQSQPAAEMWQRCARRVTEAIERVVAFAKRLRGFLQLSQHDQIVLLKAGRPWLQDRPRVARLQGQLDVAFRLLLRRTRREGLLARLPAPGRLRALCSQHLEQLQAFRRRHPAGASAAFPPLYRELFAPDPAEGPAGTR